MTSRAVWSGAFAANATCRKNVRLVLWELASFTDARGGGAHPGTRLLAERCGVHRDTVTTALAWGRKHGWVQRAKQGNWRRGEADEYRLTIPAEHQIAKVSREPESNATVPDQKGHTIGTTTSKYGGLSASESADLDRLQAEEKEYQDRGHPYGFPQKDFDRMSKLISKHLLWRRQLELAEQEEGRK